MNKLSAQVNHPRCFIYTYSFLSTYQPLQLKTPPCYVFNALFSPIFTLNSQPLHWLVRFYLFFSMGAKHMLEECVLGSFPSNSRCRRQSWSRVSHRVAVVGFKVLIKCEWGRHVGVYAVQLHPTIPTKAVGRGV